MLANLPPVFDGYSHLGAHGNSSRRVHVVLRQSWIFMDVFSCELEQDAYAFECDLLGFMHGLLRSPCLALRQSGYKEVIVAMACEFNMCLCICSARL